MPCFPDRSKVILLSHHHILAKQFDSCLTLVTQSLRNVWREFKYIWIIFVFSPSKRDTICHQLVLTLPSLYLLCTCSFWADNIGSAETQAGITVNDCSVIFSCWLWFCWWVVYFGVSSFSLLLRLFLCKSNRAIWVTLGAVCAYF